MSTADPTPSGDSRSPSQGDTNSSGNSPEGHEDQAAMPEKTREKNANRACEACRRLKVRCLPPPADQPDQKCKRCAKNGQECIFLPRSRTRRRKRIDTRVGELENQIKALSSHFQQQGHASEDFKASLAAFNDVSSEIGRRNAAATASPTSASRVVEQRPLDGLPAQFPPRADARKPSHGFSPEDTHHLDGSLASLADDVVGRGFLSMKEAAVLYQRFSDDAVQHCAIVIAPKGLTAMEARRSKPMLFLAIIAAMAASNDPSLGYRLNQELTKLYADRVFLQGERSLEAMQSLLVSAYWHFPPERYEQLKYTQFIHMATTMALDMGLGEPKIDVPTVTFDTAAAMETAARKVSDDMERRRTWLACYVTCTSLSISLKRPSMLNHSAYITDCVQSLASSPEAAPYDYRIVAWAKLQYIMEPLNISSLASVNASSYLADPDTRSLFGGIRKRLRMWDLDFPLNVVGPAIRLVFDHYKLSLLEIVLHADHDLEDFRPPFRLRKARVRRDATMNSRDPIYAEAVADCLCAAHSILDLFLAMDPHAIRYHPTITFVRTIYASVILIKLQQSATDASSQLGPFVDLPSVQIERYMGGLYGHLLRVADGGQCYVAGKFLGALTAIRAWCCKVVAASQSGGEEQQQTDELIEPLLHLSLTADPGLCSHRAMGGVSLEKRTAPAPPVAPSRGALPKHTTSPEWIAPTSAPPTSTAQLGAPKAQPHHQQPLPPSSSSSNLQYFIPNPAFPYAPSSLPDFPTADPSSSSSGRQISSPSSTSAPFSFNPTPPTGGGADVPMDPFPSEPTADYYTTEYALDQMEGWMPDLEFIEGLDLSSFIQQPQGQGVAEWGAFGMGG